MTGTPNPTNISTKLERIAKLAKDMPGASLRTLAHHIDIGWLKEAYRRTWKWLRRRSWGAPRFESMTRFAQLFKLVPPRLIHRPRSKPMS